MICAIVTGHSKGLGAALCKELLSRNVAVLGLSRHPLPETPQTNGDALQQVEIDLADSTAITHWLAQGQLARFLAQSEQALLINNAGTLQPMGLLGNLAANDIARAVALNLTAPLILSDAFVAASEHCRDRRILHISSGAGRNAYPGWGVYCASKAALDRHAQAIAQENPAALRIASLAPGVIDTDMQAEIRACPSERFPLRERFVALQQQGQLSDPLRAAKSTVDYLLAANFAANPLADLRDLAP